jgi:hypothetical protein
LPFHSLNNETTFHFDIEIGARKGSDKEGKLLLPRGILLSFKKAYESELKEQILRKYFPISRFVYLPSSRFHHNKQSLHVHNFSMHINFAPLR